MKLHNNMSVLKKAYALLIGVGKDLPVTVRDANAIRNILADQHFAGYPKDNIILLTEEHATREGILSSFDQLIEKIDEDSSVLIFYSGHGGTYLDNDILEEADHKPEEENHRHYYLLPNNFDPENFDETWVTAEELKHKIRSIPSRRIVMLLDCCHAAGMTKSARLSTAQMQSRSMSNPEVMAQHIEDGQGISIISSCREDQQSFILDGDSNSLFTKCLIEVLRGKHKENFTDPFIRITEVTQYLFKRVPELIENQKPYVNLQIYDDFILSRVPGAQAINQTTITTIPPEKEDYQTVKTTFRKDVEANNLILFVHGFAGEASQTFGETPAQLMNDHRFLGWDMLPLGLTETVQPNLGNQVWASQLEVEMLADYLTTSLKTKFDQYDRIAILGHGLGGIIAQLSILDLPASIRSKISHLLLFACPNNGLSKDLLQNREQQAFEYLGDEHEFIKSLRKKWAIQFPESLPFECTVIGATKDDYVPTKSNFNAIKGAKEIVIRGDHFSIVKTESDQDESYHLIVQNLLNNQFLHQVTSQEEINIALGKYYSVVNDLLPRIDELDQFGVQTLCFALEGLDRGEEAIQILQSRLSEDEASLYSTLAGRFKRLYLSKFHEKEGQQSVKFYELALEQAIQKSNQREIYYNAINLAFLAVVYKNDLNLMNHYNEIAKQALANDPFPSLWKLATEAEAAMYEANFEQAKEKYSLAAEKANLRQKLSIYTNAYTAYTHLMNTKHAEDPMIRFLHKTLLS